MVLRIIFMIYIGVSSVILYMTLSHFLFSNQKLSRRSKFLFKMLVLIPLWPLSLFSVAGRRKLFNQIKGKY